MLQFRPAHPRKTSDPGEVIGEAHDELLAEIVTEDAIAEATPAPHELPRPVAGRMEATDITLPGAVPDEAAAPAVETSAPTTANLPSPIEAETGTVDREAHLHLQPLDLKVVARQLEKKPAAAPLPPLPPLEVERKLTANGMPRRVYNLERGEMVVVEGNEARAFPFVSLPVLFVNNTPDLLDQQSRDAIESLADVILQHREKDTDAIFEVQAHTSLEGPEDFNLRLSAERAKRVHHELTQRYRVPPEMLAAYGYGENYPLFPEETGGQSLMNRRVLIVRIK